MEQKKTKRSLDKFLFSFKFMKKITLEKIIYYIVLIVMIGTLVLKLCSYLPFVRDIWDFSSKRVYLLWGSIFFLLCTYIYGIISKKIKINYIDIIIYILIFLGFISTTFALDFEKSFFGAPNRYEGLLTILSYYFLMLNTKYLTNQKYKENIIKVFIGLGIFQAIYGILQAYTSLLLIRHYPFMPYMAMGLCSNPNFYSSYMLMQVLLVSSLYIQNKKIIYLFLTILFGMNLYLAQSSGPVLALIITLIFMFIYFKDKIKSIIIVILVLLVTFTLTEITSRDAQKKLYNMEIPSNYNIPTEIVNTVNVIKEKDEKALENIGSGRIYVWKRSLPLFKEYGLVGAGLDNFEEAYPQVGEVRYDKAHNVYLQIGITNGIPALLLYLSLCFIIFIKGFKYKNNLFKAIYIAFIGYSIQAFANISVIEVAPYFFIFMGLLASNQNDTSETVV